MSDRWLPNPPPYPSKPPLEWPRRDEPASAPPAPPEPGSPNRVPMPVVVVGVVLVASLATFALLLLLRPPKRDVAAEPPPSTTTSPTVPPTVPGAATPDSQVPSGPPAVTQAVLSRDVPGLRSFVETHRQLRFERAPTVALDSPAVYLRAWRAYLGRDRVLLDHLDVVLTAFGLNPSNVDLSTAKVAWLGDDTVGFYDPATKVVHVRAVPYTAYVRRTLVDSLTRSLDDQRFSIGRLDPAEGLGDAQYALAALVSGDARTISTEWLSTRPYVEQQSAQGEERDRTPQVTDPALVPVAFAGWLTGPDEIGPDLVKALTDAGGVARLDRAFVAPPTGSREVLSPEYFLAGNHEVAVPMPAPGGTVVASGRFGQTLLQEALDGHVDSDVLSQAMEGYLGDATVAWRSHGESCVRIRVATTNRSAAGDMAHAIDSWSQSVRASYVVVADPGRAGVPLIEATVCHTGGGTSSPTTTVPGAPSYSPDTGPVL